MKSEKLMMDWTLFQSKIESLVFNTDLVETLEFDNLIRQAVTTVDSAFTIEKKVEGLMRETIFLKETMKNLCNTLLAWCDGKNTKISYREVHKSTLTNEVQYFPPQERVY